MHFEDYKNDPTQTRNRATKPYRKYITGYFWFTGWFIYEYAGLQDTAMHYVLKQSLIYY